MSRLPRSRGRVCVRSRYPLAGREKIRSCDSSGGLPVRTILARRSSRAARARPPRRGDRLIMSGYSLGDTSVKTTLKYGLNPAAKKKGLPGKAKKGPLKPALAAFAEDSDDDDAKDERERTNAEIMRQQQAARNAQKVKTPAPPSRAMDAKSLAAHSFANLVVKTRSDSRSAFPVQLP